MDIRLHPADTPHRAYERLMRFGAFATAARVASQFDLGRDLLIRALDNAIRRFEELGHPELAADFAEELGFTIVNSTVAQLPQLMRALERCENGPAPGSDPHLAN